MRRFVGERAIDVQWKSMSNGFHVFDADKSSHNRYCPINVFRIFNSDWSTSG